MKEIVEVQFGYDGIVFAVDAKASDWALEPKDVYLALAAEVPKDGKLVANPPRLGKRLTTSFPIGRSSPTSPARSTARAKCSRRRS